MRALLIDHNAPNHLRMGEAPDPVPGPAQVVIQVVGTSLNRGEVAFRAPVADEGAVLGWDASGIVVTACRRWQWAGRGHAGPDRRRGRRGMGRAPGS